MKICHNQISYMKKFLSFLFSLLVFFLIGFAFARFKPLMEATISFAKPQTKARFEPTDYPLKNRPFAIVIVGRNNGASAEKTLRSVFSQNYENYRVIYIDDASDDGSFIHARDLIYDSGSMHRVHLIQNERPLGMIENLTQAIATCDDEEIVVLLGEDDFLAHEWVIQKLNQYFANPDLWLALGQYMIFPDFSRGPKESYFDPNIRDAASHLSFHQLKIFYAALFKKIDPTDLLYHGQFMPDSSEMAYMIPLLEMSKGHIECIDDVLYLTLAKTTKKSDMQSVCEVQIKDKRAYSPLNQLFEYKEAI